MHASARRRRGRTYVQSLCRGGVRVETDHRPGQKLTEVHVPAAYVAADEVGVLPFEIRRPGDALRKNTVPETGGETFYLVLDPLGHVEGRAVWDVAVGPDGVLAFRGSCFIEEALLGEQGKRALGMLAPPHGDFPRRDLLQRAAQVDGAGASARFGLPGDRTIECKVCLEDAGAVAVASEGPPVPFGEVFARELQELPRRHVEENRPGLGHFVHRADPDAGIDL